MLLAGDRAPDFELPDLLGTKISLSNLVKSGPVLLAFFKTNCPTCQYTFPFLQRFTDRKAAPVVGVSQDEPLATKAFLKTYGVKFPVLLDTKAGRYPVSNRYALTHVPAVFLIGPDLKITAAFHGFSRKDLEEIGHRFQFAPFAADEQIPAFRPG